MSIIIGLIYDAFMAPAEAACLKDWRRELLKNVHGDILEIGAGTGANIDFYPDSVNSLVFSEPDRAMRAKLELRVADSTIKKATVSSGWAEDVGSGTEQYDYIVTSLVCCTVKNPSSVLKKIHRALKPGGRLIFLEHVAAEAGTGNRKWQDRLNPFWKKISGNCHLNRETEKLIVSAGFNIIDIKRESMKMAPPIFRPTIRGSAIKN